MMKLDSSTLKEILPSFCQESGDLLAMLEKTLARFEDTQKVELFEEYGQIIDRMMGAAANLGFDQLAKYCEYGKTIGYKQSQWNEPKAMAVTSSILEELNEGLRLMLEALKTQESYENAKVNHQTLEARLEWAIQKLRHIQRSSVALDEKEDEEINGILDNDDDQEVVLTSDTQATNVTELKVNKSDKKIVNNN